MFFHRKVKVLLGVILVVLGVGMILSGCSGGSSSEPRLTLIKPRSRNYTTDEPEINIRFECLNIDEMRLDNRKLTTRDVERICSRQGLDYDLDEGDNDFYFEGYHTVDDDRDRFRVRLEIEYDPEL